MNIDINRFSDRELVEIYTEVLRSLDKHKQELVHTLRYRDNGYIVPEKIEKMLKALVKKQYDVLS
jgi:hypothetical protein